MRLFRLTVFRVSCSVVCLSRLRFELQRREAPFVILELIVVATQLLRADDVFLLECLYAAHDAVELGDNGIELVIKFPVEPVDPRVALSQTLVYSFEDGVGLFGQELHQPAFRGGDGSLQIGFGCGKVGSCGKKLLRLATGKWAVGVLWILIRVFHVGVSMPSVYGGGELCQRKAVLAAGGRCCVLLVGYSAARDLRSSRMRDGALAASMRQVSSAVASVDTPN
jgi:hypothetical protein